MNLGPYAKAVSGTVAAGFTAAIAALADGNVTGTEWAGIAVTVLVAAAAIYAVPNFPSRARSYAKAITSGLVGGLGSLAIALTDGGGVSSAEWLTIAIAVLVGAGLVSQVPNAPVSTDTAEGRPYIAHLSNPSVRTVDLDGDGRDDKTGRFV
jgi:hypothetical protein